jgi:creatinine amidohydrolase
MDLAVIALKTMESYMRKLAISFIVLFSASLAWPQAVPQIRTRLLTKLTNTEIEQYLKRNDVIFIPVGTVEPHSEIPLDAEYVGPLAYALKLAEEADGLVLPGMVYFFPDATVVGRGAVHVTPSEGTAYLKVIARSLLRQGFRRQIYITGHGPSFQTVSPLVREFFDETHVPIIHLESTAFRRPRPVATLPATSTQPNATPPSAASAFSRLMYGAYAIAGRLEDIPLNLSEPVPPHPADPGINNLFPLGPQSGTVGFYMSDYTDHTGPAKSVTAEQRAQYAKEGTEMIEQAVKGIDIKGILQAMRDHDKYTQAHIVPQYDWMFENR